MAGSDSNASLVFELVLLQLDPWRPDRKWALTTNFSATVIVVVAPSSRSYTRSEKPAAVGIGFGA